MDASYENKSALSQRKRFVGRRVSFSQSVPLENSDEHINNGGTSNEPRGYQIRPRKRVMLAGHFWASISACPLRTLDESEKARQAGWSGG